MYATEASLLYLSIPDNLDRVNAVGDTICSSFSLLFYDLPYDIE